MKHDFNLTYDCSKINWNYNGEKFQCDFDGIEYASVQGKYVYVETYIDCKMCYHYINIETRKDICYDEKKQQILIDNKPVIVLEQKPYGVDVSNDAYIYIIIDENEIRVYNENGEYKNSIGSPKGYKYLRFFDVEDVIRVICQGNEENMDQYGRNDWKFKYENKKWIKEGIVY